MFTQAPNHPLHSRNLPPIAICTKMLRSYQIMSRNPNVLCAFLQHTHSFIKAPISTFHRSPPVHLHTTTKMTFSNAPMHTFHSRSSSRSTSILNAEAPSFQPATSPSSTAPSTPQSTPFLPTHYYILLTYSAPAEYFAAGPKPQLRGNTVSAFVTKAAAQAHLNVQIEDFTKRGAIKIPFDEFVKLGDNVVWSAATMGGVTMHVPALVIFEEEAANQTWKHSLWIEKVAVVR